jgi:hypothetical protein
MPVPKVVCSRASKSSLLTQTRNAFILASMRFSPVPHADALFSALSQKNHPLQWLGCLMQVPIPWLLSPILPWLNR